jgi:hypothetical protein
MGAKYKLVKICSVEEAEEKMEMGICFICDKPFSVEHQLQHHTNIRITMKDEEEVESESEVLGKQVGDLSTNTTKEPPKEKQEEVHGIAEDSLCVSICNSHIPKPTSTDMNMEKHTESTMFFSNSLMFGDDDPKKSQSDIEQTMISTTQNSMLDSQVILYPTHCLMNCLTGLGNTSQLLAKLSKPTFMECVVDLPKAHATLNSTLSICKSVNDIPTREYESLITMKSSFNRGLIAPPPEPPDVAATPLPNLFLLLSETKSVTATQYHNIAAYRLFPSTFQVFDQMSYYILIAQLIDLATLHDIPNLVEITSMSSNIKHVMGFAYFYYGSGSNPQDQAPKFEFDQFLGNLCMGAKLLSTNWQAELCLQEQANTSKINGIFYYLNKIESNLQQVQELEIEIQKVHIWSYLNVLFLDDYGSVLVDRQGYFDRCVRLIVGVAFPSNMMVRTYGFLLPMATSYVDLLVEANLDSGKKCFIDVDNSPTWKSCLAPLYDTYHHLTINFLLISRHTKLFDCFP